jgi:hypothetical protein
VQEGARRNDVDAMVEKGFAKWFKSNVSHLAFWPYE